MQKLHSLQRENGIPWKLRVIQSHTIVIIPGRKDTILLYLVSSYLILRLHYYPLVPYLHVSVRLHFLCRRRNRHSQAILDILTILSSNSFRFCDALQDLQLKTNNSTSKQAIKASFSVYRP